MSALTRRQPGAKEPDFTRLCTTTWVLKGLRTKYCVKTGACVEEFDHYCPWLNTAVGKDNHRPFLFLCFIEALTQLCHLYLLFVVGMHLIPSSSCASSRPSRS